MGLDMYLRGRKFHWTDWDTPEEARRKAAVDGFEVSELILSMGYWRKHPNLHGYIVSTFAEGVDECQEIELSLEDLQKTLAASEADELPATTGFFFGESCPEDKKDTRRILKEAIAWLRASPKRGAKKAPEAEWSRSVYYQASW